MSITIAAQKNVSFKAPYAGVTFQSLTRQILGRDGYLSGGATGDNGSLITVQPFAIVQRGIIVTTAVAGTALPVPTVGEPWYLLASVPDDDLDSGVVVSVTSDLLSALTGTILAFKTNGIWQNPRPVDVKGAAERAAAELGVESGFDTRVVLSGDLADELVVGGGTVVDPDGVRRILPVTGGSNEVGRFSPLAAHAQQDRIDYLALRQREPFSPEVTYLQGGSQSLESGPTSTITKVIAQRLAYVAERGGVVARQWFAWGDSTDLQVQGGPAGEAFAEATLLTGSSAISAAWLPGLRIDGAVLVLYVDGIDLRLASFNGTTGSLIGSPITIDTQAGAISHVRAVLDANDKLHVVYEHDEGPNQQIYYTRVKAAVSGFGTADVTPRIVSGADTTRNDTFPSIALDRTGRAHVVYVSGTGANTFGNFAYVVLTQAGLPESVSSFTGTTGAGFQADPNDGLGFAAQTYTSFRRARVVVTPHDEVYALMIGTPTAGSPNHLLLYSPTFRSRLGFDIVNVATVLTGNGLGCDLIVNDPGDLRAVAISNDGTSHVRAIGIDTVFAPTGAIGESQLFDSVLQTGVAGVASDQTDDLLAAKGPDGDFVYSFALSSAVVRKYPAFANTALGRTRATPHPKDIYLSGARIPSNGTGAVPTSDGRFGVFHATPKRLLHPFLVSDRGGRYTGYDGLHEAARDAAREGGVVEIRPGYYSFESGPLSTVQLKSHVSLRGDGRVLLENCTILVAPSSSSAITSFSGNVLRSSTLITGIVEGDVLNLTGAGGTGLHRVRRVLPAASGFPTRLLLDNSSAANAVPGGTAFQVWPVGVHIENLTLRGAIVDLTNAYAPTVRGITVVGTRTTGQVIKVVDCQVALVDDVEALGLDTLGADAATALVLLDGGTGAVVRNVRMRDGDGKIVHITNDAQNPHLVDVTGDRSDPTKKLFTIDAGRTTPVYMTGCDGRSDDLDQSVIQPVAPVLRASPDGGALTFEDDNTRAGSIVDDRIKLSGPGTQQQFNGSVTDIVTGAVNQRVRTAGDTMTGNLLPTGDALLNLGALATRWNAFVGVLDFGNDGEVADTADGNVVGHLIPAGAGRNLGNDTENWFVHAANLRVHGFVDRDMAFTSGESIILSGTGELYHDARVHHISAFESVFTVGAWSPSVGTDPTAGFMESQGVVSLGIGISGLREGDRILEVRPFLQDTVGDVITITVMRVSVTGTSSVVVAGASSGSGTLQSPVLTVGAENVGGNKFHYVVLDPAAAGAKFWGVRVTYDHPPP